MKFFATLAFVATAAAQEEAADAASTVMCKKSEQTNVTLTDADGKGYGGLCYFTEACMDGETAVNSTLYVQCMPQLSGNKLPSKNDYHDQDFQCDIGSITDIDDATGSKPNNRNLLDWCRVKGFFKPKDGNKIEKHEVKDGNLKQYSTLNDNDKYNFNDDSQGDCNLDMDNFKIMGHENENFQPILGYSKALSTSDTTEDNLLEYGKNYTFLWKLKTKDTDVKGKIMNLMLKDPFSGAKTVAASVATMGALVFANL